MAGARGLVHLRSDPGGGAGLTDEGSAVARRVAAAYDVIAGRYAGWTRPSERAGDLLDAVERHTPSGGIVLDAGCGNGTPALVRLDAAGRRVVGIDVSRAQIRAARAALPRARLALMDMRRLGFADASFDAVISLWALIHVPRAEHPAILAAFHRVLRPGGVLALTTGAEAWEGVEDFGGVQMFFSAPATDETLSALSTEGFELLEHRVEPTPAMPHLAVLARRGDA